MLSHPQNSLRLSPRTDRFGKTPITTRQQRHSHMNDIIFRAIKRAQVPAIKEPVSLMLGDNKRPDGTTLLPWARGKPLAWDVTVSDTYAESHLANTVVTPGAAANQAAQQKTDKYCSLQSTHIFCPVAIETRHMECHGCRSGSRNWQTHH